MSKIEENKHNCLYYVKQYVPIEMYEEIVAYIEEYHQTNQFSITEVVPKNEDKRTVHFDYVKDFYVTQYCNGGHTGDSYAGWVHIQISKKEYLKFKYSM